MKWMILFYLGFRTRIFSLFFFHTDISLNMFQDVYESIFDEWVDYCNNQNTYEAVFHKAARKYKKIKLPQTFTASLTLSTSY
jgi:hypothetical protein